MALLDKGKHFSLLSNSYPILMNVIVFDVLGFCIKCYECPLSRMPTRNYDANICYNIKNGLNIIGDVKQCNDNQYCFEESTLETKKPGESRTILVQKYCATVDPESHVINSCESEKTDTFIKSKKCFCDSNLCNDTRNIHNDGGFGAGTIALIIIGVFAVSLIGIILLISELNQLSKKFSSVQSTPKFKLLI